VHGANVLERSNIIRIAAQFTFHVNKLMTENVEEKPRRIVAISPDNGEPSEQIANTELEHTIPFA